MPDIAHMTKNEFIEFRNPSDKYHDDSSYDFDFKKMNQEHARYLISYETSGSKKVTVMEHPNGYKFIVDGKPVAIMHGDIVYHTPRMPPRLFPILYSDKFRDINIEIRPKQQKLVKYLNEYTHLIDNVVKRNLDYYPSVLKRFILGGEQFTIRTETTLPYSKNVGATVVILNQDGYVVAQASDEWGATLLVVAQEYRGKNLGTIIGKIWYNLNPSYLSGGFTDSGLRNAVNIWKEHVRDYLLSGKYRKLIKDGALTKEKVKEILKSARLKPKKKIETPTKEKPEILIYVDYDGVFVIYDKKFYENQTEEYVYGHGFLRDIRDGEKIYVFTIDYDSEYKKMATMIIFHIAKHENIKLYTKVPPSDVLELDYPEIVQKNDYAWLKKTIINIEDIKNYEKQYRKKNDKYGEIFHSLLEIANSKWE
jgi:hypothetical protein